MLLEKKGKKNSCKTAQHFLSHERKQKASNTKPKNEVGDIFGIAGLSELEELSVCRRGAEICGLLLVSKRRRGPHCGYTGCILFIFFIWSSAVPEERAMSVAIFLPLLCPLAVSNNNFLLSIMLLHYNTVFSAGKTSSFPELLVIVVLSLYSTKYHPLQSMISQNRCMR